MEDEPMVRHWRDVERWLRGEAVACLEHGEPPPPRLITFLRQETALVVEAPHFCDESADAVTDVMCRITHEIRPDQLLFMRTGVYRTPGSTAELHALRASLFERDRPARHLAHPLLFGAPAALVAPMPQRGTDTWTRRLQDAFDHPDLRPEIVATEPPPVDDFLIAVPPDGPLSNGVGAQA